MSRDGKHNNESQRFIDIVQSIVKAELNRAGLMTGQWHLGTVDEVLTKSVDDGQGGTIEQKTGFLKVFVNGSQVSQKIPHNPDVEFNPNDKVFVLFVNGDSKNKFVPFKRSVWTWKNTLYYSTKEIALFLKS